MELNGLLFFDWKMFFLGDEDWSFLLETLIRTVIMFVIILTGLTILGKRGVRQLSVFELVVIIGLGSAAGDPMFYKDVGILPALVVFLVVISAYILVTVYSGKHKWFEHLLEGKPVCLIEEGRFAIKNFDKEHLARDEFFAELRVKGVSQLGQVKYAYIEVSGTLSLFYYPDDEVKYGHPILPGSYEQIFRQLDAGLHYSCTHCGYTKRMEETGPEKCTYCHRDTWVLAVFEHRLS